jgi:cobalt-zinc-cadmium efflux system outer membrane protein
LNCFAEVLDGISGPLEALMKADFWSNVGEPGRRPKVSLRVLVISLLVLWVTAIPLKASPANPALQQDAVRSIPADRLQVGVNLRLDDLRQELLRSNPDLRAAQKRYEALLARPAQESALPDPRITMGWISTGWPYPGSGLGSEPVSNIGIQVAQEIPFPGKRVLKGSIAQKQAETEAQMIRAQELNLIAQLEEKFYDLRFAYESLDIVHEKQTLLEQLAQAAQARYAVGKGVQQDIIRASTEISILEDRAIVLEQKRLSLTAEINTLINRPADAELGRPEPASSIPALESFESLQARALETTPLLAAQRKVIDGRQLNVQSARKAYYPDFDIMSGYYNMGSLKPMWEFKVQVSVPLYFWHKQRYGMEEAGASLAEAQRGYRAQMQLVGSRVRELYLAAQAARKLMDLYSRQIVPQTELALESSLAGYESGGVDFLSVLSNFTMILDYQLNYRQQQAEYLKALSGITELAGSATVGSSPAQLSPGREEQR